MGEALEEVSPVTHASVDVLGVRVDPWSPRGLIREMIAAAKGGSTIFEESKATVCYANVHVLNSAYSDSLLKEQLERASTVYCDGSGVRLGAWMLGQSLPPRLTAADWIDEFCAAAARERVRIFLLGGRDGVAARAAEVLENRHLGLRIVGVHHGFLDGIRTQQAIQQVNGSEADVVIVGMGTPTQERWLLQHRHELNSALVWAVGAVLDFVAGTQRRSPAWMAAMHLEWLWRLGSEPTRLWRRYAVGNPRFVLRVLRQRLRTDGG